VAAFLFELTWVSFCGFLKCVLLNWNYLGILTENYFKTCRLFQNKNIKGLYLQALRQHSLCRSTRSLRKKNQCYYVNWYCLAPPRRLFEKIRWHIPISTAPRNFPETNITWSVLNTTAMFFSQVQSNLLRCKITVQTAISILRLDL